MDRPALPKEDLFESSTMTFGEHLEELRKALARAILWLVAGALVALVFFAKPVVRAIQGPLEREIVAFKAERGLARLKNDLDVTIPEDDPNEQQLLSFLLENGLTLQRVWTPQPAATPEAATEPSVAAAPGRRVTPELFAPRGGAVQLTSSAQEPPADPPNSDPSDAAAKGSTSGSASAEENAAAEEAAEEPTAPDPPSDVAGRSESPGPSGAPGPSDAPVGEGVEQDRRDNDERSETPAGDAAESAAETAAGLAVLPDPAGYAPAWFFVESEKGLNSHKVEEPFMIYLKASVVVGAVLASPMIFYHLWGFVAAGLYPHERRYVHIYLPFSVVLFVTGVSLAFFAVLGFVLNFLLDFNNDLSVDLEPRLSYYMSFVLLLPLGFGIAFQLPLVMLFLQRIGLIETSAYEGSWRIAVLVIAVLSMILTPADPYSMILLMAPLVFLYFLGIGLCRFMPRGRGLGSAAYDPR